MVTPAVAGLLMQAPVPAAAPPAPSWSTLLALLLSSSVVGGVLTAVWANMRASTEARREGYAETSRVLISRVEFPYRIRRRTSDAADVLSELTRTGSDIQERLAAQRTWVSGESRSMSRLLDEVCGTIDKEVRAAAEEAWRSPPIGAASEMNLGGWGPGPACQASLERFRRATTYRFGWRRLLPPVLRRHI